MKKYFLHLHYDKKLVKGDLTKSPVAFHKTNINNFKMATKTAPKVIDVSNLLESFSEFKEVKNIDRVTLISILEDVFRGIIRKKYGSDENFDVIVNDTGRPET